MARGRPRRIRPADGLTSGLTTRPALRAHRRKRVPPPEIRSEASRFETRPGRDQAPSLTLSSPKPSAPSRRASSSTNSPCPQTADAAKLDTSRSFVAPPRTGRRRCTSKIARTGWQSDWHPGWVELPVRLPVPGGPVDTHAPAQPCGFPMRSRFRRLRRRIPDHPHSTSKIEWWWSGNAGAQADCKKRERGQAGLLSKQVEGQAGGQSHQQRKP